MIDPNAPVVSRPQKDPSEYAKTRARLSGNANGNAIGGKNVTHSMLAGGQDSPLVNAGAPLLNTDAARAAAHNRAVRSGQKVKASLAVAQKRVQLATAATPTPKAADALLT
jgi:hypothetical protein